MWWGQHVQTASWKEATKKLPACLKSTLDPHLRNLQYESSESDMKILVIMTSVSVKTSEVVKHYMHRFFHTAER